MAIGTPVSIGTVQNKTSESSTVMTTTAAVPAGALIVICVAADAISIANPGATDSAGNTYERANFRDFAGNVGVDIHYAANAIALASGGTITYTFSAAQTAKAISAFYVEGIATSSVIDRSAVSDGTSATPTVSTGATTQADGLTVGIVGTEGPSGDAFTQDASPAYGNIPVRVGTSGGSAVSNITLAGGYFIESATGAKTYNPTLGTSRDWATVIVTFKGGASDQGDLTSSGTGAASLVGESTAASDASAAGAGAASLIGEALVPADLASAGTGAATFDGVGANEAELSSAGISSASITAESTAAADVAAAGVGAASLTAESTAASVIEAAGVATVLFEADSAGSDLAAAGTSTASFDGAAIVEADLEAAGTGAMTAIAESTAVVETPQSGGGRFYYLPPENKKKKRAVEKEVEAVRDVELVSKAEQFPREIADQIEQALAKMREISRIDAEIMILMERELFDEEALLLLMAA